MTKDTLIPRQKLFDNPSAVGAYISPDGRWLSWLAPCDGVMNVWLSPSDNIRAAQPLTRTKGRPIQWQMWSQDSRQVLFLNDETGDENNHLFAVDPKTAVLRDLTPLQNISVQINISSPDRPGEIVVGINDRDARWHDLYVIDIARGTRTLIWDNRQDLNEIGLDWQLRPRWARSALPAGGSQLWRIEGAELKPWLQVPYEDDLTTWPMASLNAASAASACALSSTAPPNRESNAGVILPTVKMIVPLASRTAIGTGTPCACCTKSFNVLSNCGPSAPASHSSARCGLGCPPSKSMPPK